MAMWTFQASWLASEVLSLTMEYSFIGGEFGVTLSGILGPNLGCVFLGYTWWYSEVNYLRCQGVNWFCLHVRQVPYSYFFALALVSLPFFPFRITILDCKCFGEVY